MASYISTFIKFAMYLTASSPCPANISSFLRDN